MYSNEQVVFSQFNVVLNLKYTSSYCCNRIVKVTFNLSYCIQIVFTCKLTNVTLPNSAAAVFHCSYFTQLQWNCSSS